MGLPKSIPPKQQVFNMPPMQVGTGFARCNSFEFGKLFAPSLTCHFRLPLCHPGLTTIVAKKAKPKIQSKDVQGLKYLKVLQPLLESLHDTGCTRDKACNQKLHMDHYCIMILLWLYSPLLASLRAVRQAGFDRQTHHRRRRLNRQSAPASCRASLD